jgi:hypothetical protein
LNCVVPAGALPILSSGDSREHFAGAELERDREIVRSRGRGQDKGRQQDSPGTRDR